MQNLLRVVGMAVTALALYGMLDYFLAFGPLVRRMIGVGLSAVFILLAVFRIVRVFGTSDRAMAMRADRLLGGQRRSVLSGLELENDLNANLAGNSTMRNFLLEEGIERSLADINRLQAGDCFPKSRVLQQLKTLGVQILLAVLVFLAGGEGSKAVLSRLLSPRRDVPPPSKYAFRVMPEKPAVVYGEDTEVTVEITGDAVRDPVMLITRHGGETHRAACFQESESRFAQRMENVVVPLEFCFKTGKARSKWHALDLRLQPRIAVAEARIKPPDYTGLPVNRFYVGHQDFAAYANSAVELKVTSNRPLQDGLATIRPPRNPEKARVVHGRKHGGKTVVFEWNVRKEAEVEIVIRDVQGTKNKEPLEVRQTILKDHPPDAVITQPAGFVMATPESSIALSGYAEDDLGLSRVELVRSVVGYRDRALHLGPEAPRKHQAFDEVLDLGKIGVDPGQVLEFFLEAGDFNPTMMGIAASEIVRVKIISDEEYASNLRMQETAEDFLNRYRLVAEALQELEDALEEMQDALETDEISNEKRAEKIEENRNRIKEAARQMEKLANDFPIYQMDSNLAKFADEASQMSRAMAEQVGRAAENPQELKAAVEKMLKSLKPPRQKMRKQRRDAEDVVQIRKLMECAGRFQNIYERQSELVKRLQRFKERTPRRELRLLESLGALQKQIRQDLQQLVKDIQERSKPLRNEYAALRQSAQKFAAQIEQLDIDETMSSAYAASKNQDGPRTLQYATLAAEKLEELISGCQGDAFGGMGQCELTFRIPKPSMRQTLEQMMLGMGLGSGNAGGLGIGAGGSGTDGYMVPGHSMMNIPMYGPARLSSGAAGGGETGQNEEKSGRGAASGSVRQSKHMSIEPKGTARGEGLPMENVPEKYMEAVKKYFSDDDSLTTRKRGSE